MINTRNLGRWIASALLSGVMVGAGAAVAAGAPEDVRDFARSEAPAEIAEMVDGAAVLGGNGEGESLLAAAVDPQVGDLYPVHVFTSEFMHGDLDAPILEENGTWIAALSGDGRLIGTVLVSHDPSGQIAVAELTENVVLGEALAAGRTSTLVHVPFLASWYSLEGDSLRALFVPGGGGRDSYPIEEYRQELSDSLAEAEAVPHDPAEPQVGGAGYLADSPPRGLATRWLIGGLVLVGACATGLVMMRKRNAQAGATGD